MWTFCSKEILTYIKGGSFILVWHYACKYDKGETFEPSFQEVLSYLHTCIFTEVGIHLRHFGLEHMDFLLRICSLLLAYMYLAFG